MNFTKKRLGEAGFTLIEAMIAMAIFAIGILALYAMQLAATKENITANRISTGSTWAVDKIEELLALGYEDLIEPSNANSCNPGTSNVDGCGGVGETGEVMDFIAKADYCDKRTDPLYNVYWNVATGCTLSEIPNAASETEEQKPKHLKIVVTKLTGNGTEEKIYAEFSYIKQNVR
ncbi:prepilin-type N-terminal cleavage/methylation domain-containing protein [Candidatus Electrothrix aarhusensis]|uniref:Prepilin-type N-terminal cleavage/methylation domain-containing protein n=1 Tax=Candidatus Electrothrix aarhusensis TaxID=1859131 RepID=A0A3S3QFH2_9BACT|nr:prepilin-type N-terminal cleavage/methylation domain-containing protein [Candidatus Electrothrix aarhusensis]